MKLLKRKRYCVCKYFGEKVGYDINTAAGYFVSMDKERFEKCLNSASKWNGTNLKKEIFIFLPYDIL